MFHIDTAATNNRHATTIVDHLWRHRVCLSLSIVELLSQHLDFTSLCCTSLLLSNKLGRQIIDCDRLLLEPTNRVLQRTRTQASCTLGRPSPNHRWPTRAILESSQRGQYSSQANEGNTPAKPTRAILEPSQRGQYSSQADEARKAENRFNLYRAELLLKLGTLALKLLLQALHILRSLLSLHHMSHQ